MSLSQIKSLITYRQNSEPSSPSIGEVWMNTESQVIKCYNGSSWDIIWSGISGKYGYFAGGTTNGSSYLSTVERIEFPFDYGTANHVGNLSCSAVGGCGFNSTKYGYVIGGGICSNIERFQFSFDSGTSLNVGFTPYSNENDPASFNSSQHGFMCGGYDVAITSAIYRLEFPFDSGSLSNVGSLSVTRRYINGGFNSSQHGFSLGGFITLPNAITTIDRILFPFNSGTASNVGNLSSNRCALGSCNSSIYGFTFGGSPNANDRSSIIDRVTFPFNSGTASNVGNLNKTGMVGAGCNSTTYGYVHNRSGTTISSIERIQFPFNSGTSTDVGNLTENKYYGIGIDNTDFITQFI